MKCFYTINDVKSEDCPKSIKEYFLKNCTEEAQRQRNEEAKILVQKIKI